MQPSPPRSRLRIALFVLVPLLVVLAGLLLVGPSVLRLMRPAGPSPQVATPTSTSQSEPPADDLDRQASADAASPGERTPTATRTVRPTPTPRPTRTPAPTRTATELPTATATRTATVTPIIVTPRPPPKDVFESATRTAQETADVRQYGPPTATPFNVITATFTPAPIVITLTPTPGNAATATYVARLATVLAEMYGTPTPLPAWVVIATDPPTATRVPLVVPITPHPWPTVTATPPAGIPADLVGKILFRSDRAGSDPLYAVDPANGRLYAITEAWPYTAALAHENRSPDGQYTAEVQMMIAAVTFAQIFVRDNQFGTARQLTNTRLWSYDPVWSPAGDRIAFVSQDPDNDEIYTIRPDGSDLKRLTWNTWEWDKHPSWSPDSKQIVFYSNRESGRRQLWVMNADGSNQRLLLKSPSNDWDPLWVKPPMP